MQTAHSMMAIANHFIRIRKRLQAGSQRTKRHEFCTLDSAKLVLPRLTHIDENQFFSTVQPRLYIGRSDLQFIHLISLPDRWTLFQESKNSLTRISILH